MAHIERFAPSPTGYLHLGHAFSALTVWEQGGGFLLRIEDSDHTRVRPKFEQAIYDDLHWLGLDWPEPVLRQSDNMPAYTAALSKLRNLGLTFECNCTRSDIKEAQPLPIYGPDGMVYPGTCLNKGLQPSKNTATRLNMAKAITHLEDINQLTFADVDGEPTQHFLNAKDLFTKCGDVVLARRDIGTSYHLAVVVDDAAQNITHVTRGRDLFEATQIHRLLQALLSLTTPIYRHHRLILDENGKRLAKADNSRAIRKYREEGATPQDIRAMVGL